MDTPLPTPAEPTGQYGDIAEALALLSAAGLAVPAGFVIPTDTPDPMLPRMLSALVTSAEGRAPYGFVTRPSTVLPSSVTLPLLHTSRFCPPEEEALLRLVRETRRAAGSFHRHNARGEERVAVLVQPALRPVLSGVLMAEVAGGRCARWRIEAVRGLAASLADGTQTGEIHTGRRHHSDPVTPTDQRVILVPGTRDELLLPPGARAMVPGPRGEVAARVALSEGGAVHLLRPEEWASTPLLDRRQLTVLLSQAFAAAAVLECDRIGLEWAVTPQDVVLLQAIRLTHPLPGHSGPESPSESRWSGTPAAPGVATGPAVRLRPETRLTGAVLICETLDTQVAEALRQRPAAIVSTTGSPLSLTAHLARELGIPCVTNVDRSIEEAAPGAQLQTDGTEGRARVLRTAG
ncbi:PEP-utilizing enzyme [Streptomyces sp. NPDC054796]